MLFAPDGPNASINPDMGGNGGDAADRAGQWGGTVSVSGSEGSGARRDMFNGPDVRDPECSGRMLHARPRADDLDLERATPGFSSLPGLPM
jgi:hypothetical protein